LHYPSWETISSSIFTKTRYFPMLERDMPTFMGLPIAMGPSDLEGVDVAIIGAPFVTGWDEYAGVSKDEWIAGPKRVRQQSVRYASGYVQDFDIDIFEHLRVVDYGDADIPAESLTRPTVENILAAQAAVEAKVNDVLDAGAVPVVLGQNSPCGSYAIAKPIAERTSGKVGVISLDTHWDAGIIDRMTQDPRIAGANNWKRKMFDSHPNISVPNLVEIGERGMLENKDIVREYLRGGAHFYPMWAIRTELGVEGLCRELAHAYDGTDSVYAHFDMDVLGGAGPAQGDILGELAEPIGMSDYEVIRTAYEIGRRGVSGLSFICIPPGSAAVYRVIVYVVAYMMAGLASARANGSAGR